MRPILSVGLCSIQQILLRNKMCYPGWSDLLPEYLHPTNRLVQVEKYDQTIVDLAAQRMSELFGGPVRIQATERFESDRKCLLRCRISHDPQGTPSTIVIQASAIPVGRGNYPE